jgi:hypothetical protein
MLESANLSILNDFVISSIQPVQSMKREILFSWAIIREKLKREG